jgi:hypothetical protein
MEGDRQWTSSTPEDRVEVVKESSQDARIVSDGGRSLGSV